MEFGIVKRNNVWRGRLSRLARMAPSICLILMLASCDTESPGYSYTIGGVVSGLAGSNLVLQNNGGDDMTLSANGSFSFPHAVPDGGTYSVTVKTQPSGIGQICTVANGTGVIQGSVASVQINCVQPPARFAVDSVSSVAYAYASKYTGTTTTAFTVDTATGALALNGTATAGTNPNAVTVATVGSNKYAYVPNFGSNTVSAYAVSGLDGTLTALSGSPVAAGTNPYSVTVATVGSNKYAYVPNFNSNNISVYSIGAGGGLTFVAAVTTGTNPTSVIIHPTLSVAYVSCSGSGGIYVHTIDSGTGLLQAGTLVTSGANPGPFVMNSSGTFAYVANAGSNTVSTYTINASTGALIPGYALSTASNPVSAVMDADEKFLFVVNFRSSTLANYTIGTGGLLTAGSAVVTGINPYAVTTVKIGAQVFAYVVNYYSNTVSAYVIDTSLGSITEISGSPVAAGTNPYAITVSKTSTSVYVAHVLNAGSGNISTYTINSSSGLPIPVGTAISY